MTEYVWLKLRMTREQIALLEKVLWEAEDQGPREQGSGWASPELISLCELVDAAVTELNHEAG